MGNFFSLNSYTLHYELHNAEGGNNKPPLVFIHGAAGDLRIWKYQVSYFREYFQLLVVDLLHHGKSTTTNNNTTLKNNAMAISDLVNHLGLDSAIILGYSLGGPVMIELAYLLDTKVVGLIAVDSLPPIPGSNFDHMDPESVSKMVAFFKSDFVGTFGNIIETQIKLLPSENDKDLVRKGIEQCNHVGVLMMMEDMMRWNVFVELEKSRKYELVGIMGRNTFPDRGRKILERGEYFVSRFVDEANHFLMLEQADVFNKILEEELTKILATKL